MKGLIVITGASSGIGLAAAKLFSEMGHPLLLLARRVEQMQALNLPHAICTKLDVTDREAFKEAIKTAEKEFGPTAAIINNAGVMLLGEVHKQDPSEWDKMFDVNVKGLMNGVHAVVDGMMARRKGMIINVSSIAGKKTFPKHVGYVGSKFAVHGLTENLREELSPYNIRVTTIAPGAVATELLGHTTDKSIIEDYIRWGEESKMKILEPTDVAHAIAYAFNQPEYVNIREIVLASTQQGA